MGINVNHVHIKTKAPIATAKCYVDNFGARIKQQILAAVCRSTCTGYSSTSHADQGAEPRAALRHEHIALTVDDYLGTLSKLKANGVEMLEELPPNNGRRVCFLAATDGRRSS
jgi:Glyoxalase/Bleomycin resistance protein/Dioxygenase superfamily